MEKYIAPSLLSANFYNLQNDMEILKTNGIKYIHLDVMDGIFVPNISFGIPVIKKIDEYVGNDFVFDTHLMITEPIRYVKEFKNAGADILTFHYEATEQVEKTIIAIRESGMKIGISIKPKTDVGVLANIIDKVDLVLVMSVEPGFGGQKFIEDSLNKVKELVEIRNEKKLNYIIEIDGGINKGNIKRVFDAGVDIAVAGSAVFGGDISGNIKDMT